MSDASIVYTINLLIGALLAGAMTRHWRLEAGGRSLPYWIVAAWVLTVADLLFLLRALFPDGMPRPVPTIMVTVGHALLWLAAQRFAWHREQVAPMTTASPGAPPALAATPVAPPPVRPWWLTGVVVVHATLLITYTFVEQLNAWRTVTNGLVWGGLSFAAAWTLWHAEQAPRREMAVPALVLAGQGGFHLLRTALATHVVVQDNSVAAPLVQTLGDLEVSLFMVALFVSVLVAFLQQSHREWREAMENVRTLSGMLPLCAWCHKVRDDDGYWTRIEEYLRDHRVNVTHGLCDSCAADHFDATRVPPPQDHSAVSSSRG